MSRGESARDDLHSASLSGGDLPPEQESLALLAKAQDGDEAALHDLLKRYQDRLLRILRIQVAHVAAAVRARFDGPGAEPVLGRVAEDR